MTKLADLELSLRRSKAGEAGKYDAELEYSPANADSDDRQSAKELAIDPEALRTIANGAKYGAALGAAVFQGKLAELLQTARGASRAVDASLRLRVRIDADAPELHAVRWEALRDAAGEELLNGSEFWFSRYLSSAHWKPVVSRPDRGLKALVVIASPAELAGEPAGMKPLPVEKEKAWAIKSLAGIALTHLTSGAEKPEDKPTLSNILAKLREPCDIFFLICHGQLKEEGPRLWLENEQGGQDVVRAAMLVEAMANLAAMPRLVVLASCESANTGAVEGALSGLGPLLAAAGVPAVMAMQGKIQIDTIDEFMPAFFKELKRDGQIDHAMAVARGEAVIKKRDDYWMPVLFMRLRSGSIWYKPGFGDTSKTDEARWTTIKAAIRKKICTPILGPGLVESLVGSTRGLAQALAREAKFPLSPSSMEDLPTVAQYLAVDQGNTFILHDSMQRAVVKELQGRFGGGLKGVDAEDLKLMVSAAGALQRAASKNDPHRILAAKRFPIYITANPDNLMEDALIAEGVTPESDFARWNDTVADVKRFPTLRDRSPDFTPKPETPLVYHLYGQLSVPESLVMTEDDYFDYLLRIGSKADGKNLTPLPVGTALTANALLFIGFRLDDWSFRVLLRSIFAKEGSAARGVGPMALPCVGAQMTPEEDRILKPAGASQYFEKYLRTKNTDIFWGGVEEFIEELERQTAVQP